MDNGVNLFVSNKSISNHQLTSNKNLNQQLATKLPQMANDTVSFSSKQTEKSASGLFANKKFTINCKEGLNHRKLSGAVGEDLKFNISHNGKFLQADTLTGDINGKPLNLKVSENLFSKTIKGSIGDIPVDLKAKDSWSGYNIKGQFKGKEIDIKLNSKFVGYSLESDKMSLRIKNKTLFGNDVNVQGTYNDDPDLIPILMDMVYCLNLEEALTVLLI